MASKTNDERCCHIAINGDRCRSNKNVTHMRYHGDPEICQGDRSQWVHIALCEKHSEAWGRRKERTDAH